MHNNRNYVILCVFVRVNHRICYLHLRQIKQNKTKTIVSWLRELTARSWKAPFLGTCGVCMTFSLHFFIYPI